MRTKSDSHPPFSIFADEDRAFESLADLSAEDREKANVRNIVRLLTLQQTKGWRHVLNWSTFKFAFWQDDAIARGHLLTVLQEGLNKLGALLRDSSEIDEAQLRKMDILIASILTYIPFTYPEKDTSISLPQYLDGQWQTVDYKVIPIKLTADRTEIWPFFTKQDHVWAFGLQPDLPDKKVSPWLLYQGTTYPSGAGFWSDSVSDMKPFQTVGHDLFISGMSELEAWFEQGVGSAKMKVTGLSLGGALSCLTACHFGDQCQKIIAFNAPGLVENKRLTQINRWQDFADSVKPDVMIIKQGLDPVSLFGRLNSDWSIYRSEVTTNEPNVFTNHFVSFAFAPDNLLSREYQDTSDFAHYRDTIGYGAIRAALYYLVVLPVRYLMVPSYRLATWLSDKTVSLAKWVLLSIYQLAKLILLATYSVIAMVISFSAILLINLAKIILSGIRSMVHSIGQLVSRWSQSLEEYEQDDEPMRETQENDDETENHRIDDINSADDSSCCKHNH